MSLNIATELVAHVAAYLSGREAGAPGGGSYSGDMRFDEARNSDEVRPTNKFDSDLLDTIYEVGDLLEERGGGMGLMIGRRAD